MVNNMLELRLLTNHNNVFCVNGQTTLLESRETKLFVRNPDLEIATALDLSEPLSASSKALFLKAGEIASFGKGNKTVVDPTFPKALAISPSNFSSSSRDLKQLSAMLGISSKYEIQASLTNSTFMRLGDFLTHLDTPRSENMFGSLVVGLPIAHKGGELKVRYKRKEQTFSFEPENENDSLG
ncbi:hypothetical protein HK098_005066 [Nowakowskiella sp. JEL0407]|nr:hypothetical protein HK098_005066 [Nowakowskiella sp. JEL0407]